MAEVGSAGDRKGGVKGYFLMQGRSHSTDGGWDGENAGRSKFSGGKEGAERSLRLHCLPVSRSLVLPLPRGCKLPENFLAVDSTFPRPGFKSWICTQ